MRKGEAREKAGAETMHPREGLKEEKPAKAAAKDVEGVYAWRSPTTPAAGGRLSHRPAKALGAGKARAASRTTAAPSL